MKARLSALPWWGWILAAAAVVVGLVAAIGGFAQTPISKVPTISLGDVYEGRQVDSRVESVGFATEVPPGMTVEAGSQVVVATVRLVNRADDPVSLSTLELMLLINEIDYVKVSEQQFSARELDFPSSLQPGVPTEMLYFWEVPSTVAAGDAAIIGMLESVPDSRSVYGEDKLTEPLAVRRIDVTLDRDAPRSGATRAFTDSRREG